MARPVKCRCVSVPPGVDYFKPRGIPLADLEEVVLQLDELEALRLADSEGLYQEKAARKMKVSRATFGNIVASARKKVADAIVHSRAIRIEGGACRLASKNRFRLGCCPGSRKCNKMKNNETTPESEATGNAGDGECPAMARRRDGRCKRRK